MYLADVHDMAHAVDEHAEIHDALAAAMPSRSLSLSKPTSTASTHKSAQQ